MDAEKYIKYLGSRSVMILIGLLAFLQFTRLSTFQKEDAIRHDMKAYYGYLPAFFIHGDLTLKSIPQEEAGYYDWTVEAENGRVFKMTMGVALFNAPAFFIADSFARLGGEKRTGHDSRYYFFVFLTALVCFVKGLQWVYEITRRYAGFFLSLLITLCLGFGTNLMYYAFDEPVMSHVYSFFLYTLLLKSTLEWTEDGEWKSALAIGLAIGLLTLIRPIHALAAIVPITYTLLSKTPWKSRLIQILGAVIQASLCVFPQLLYWKYVSGQWLFYSYGDEGFFFESPMLWNGYFGFRKGWLIYTPFFFLLFPGIYYLYKEKRALLWSLLPFLFIYSYVVFSWWCWWYGGSFGSRSMIDIMALCVPFIAVALDRWRILSRAPIAFPLAIAFLVIYLNVFQTKQYRSSLLHWDGMNKELYETIWMEKHFPKNYQDLVKRPDYDSAKKGIRKP